MAVQNPNNWHWVDKNCIAWAKKYFNEKLPGLNTGDKSKDAKYCEIKSVSSIEGDCEVNQRKGKVISLFDLQLMLLITGHVDGEEYEGSIQIPEVAFDSDINDYQFEVSIYKETAKLHEAKETIREKLIPQLRDIFQNFGKDLLKEHGSDIQVPESEVKSNFTKANQQTSMGSVKSNTTTTTTSAPNTTSIPIKPEIKKSTVVTGEVNNTTTIHLEPTFNVPSFEIFNTFVDKERILIWSKSPIEEVGETTQGSPFFMIGDKFKLFNGNIYSEIVESKLGELLIMKWRLKDWKPNVYSTMNIEFHESKEFNETKLKIVWSGIPVGEEDRVRSNFEDYYIRPIKLTFGFGLVL